MSEKLAPLDGDEWEFAKACDEYRKKRRKRWMASSEYLAVARALGYEKVTRAEEAEGPAARQGGDRHPGGQGGDPAA